jgi:hypothetical protein
MKALSLILICVFSPACLAQDVLVRPVIKPAPVSLAELKTLPGHVPSVSCDFETLPLDSTKLSRITLKDSATLMLAKGWNRLPAHESDVGFDVTRIAPLGKARARIQRERNGAKGRAFLMYRSGDTPEGYTCFVQRGEVGAIWTFYDPDPGENESPLRFGVFGDVMTPARRWYRVSAFSATPDEREYVAKMFTELLMLQRE